MTQRDLDLPLVLVCAGLAVVAVASTSADEVSLLRITIGLVVVVLAPGYVISIAVFPRRDELSALQRFVLAVSLSLVLVPALGLVIHHSPLKILPLPVAVIHGMTLAGATVVAHLRRRAVDSRARFHDPLQSPRFVRWTIACVVAVVAVVGAVLLTERLRPVEHFTEFYLLGSQGKLDDYPTVLAPGETFTVLIGVGNHEGRPMQYRIEIPFSQSIPTVLTPEVQAGARWETLLTLSAPPGDGLRRLPLELFRPQDAHPYRSLYLSVELTGSRMGGSLMQVVERMPPLGGKRPVIFGNSHSMGTCTTLSC